MKQHVTTATTRQPFQQEQLINDCLQCDFQLPSVTQNNSGSHSINSQSKQNMQRRRQQKQQQKHTTVVLDTLIDALYLSPRNTAKRASSVYSFRHLPSPSPMLRASPLPPTLQPSHSSGDMQMPNRRKKKLNNKLRTESRECSSSLSTKSERTFAYQQKLDERMKRKRMKRNSKPNLKDRDKMAKSLAIVKRIQSSSSDMHQHHGTQFTIWELLKMGSMKRQNELMEQLKRAEPVDPIFMDCNNIVYQVHSYIQNCIRKNTELVYSQSKKSFMRKVIREQTKRRQQKQLEQLKRENQVLNGLFKYRSNITRHQFKALIRNVAPHKFQNQTSTPTNTSAATSSNQLQQQQQSALNPYETFLNETQQQIDQALKYHREKLQEIERLLSDDLYEEDEVEVNSNRQTRFEDSEHNTTQEADISFDILQKTPTSTTTKDLSMLFMPTDTYLPISNHLDKAVPTFAVAWYLKGKRSESSLSNSSADRLLSSDGNHEHSQSSVDAFTSSLSETKVKLFHPYSPLKIKGEINQNHYQQQQQLQSQQQQQTSDNSDTSDKASSLVIAFQQMILKEKKPPAATNITLNSSFAKLTTDNNNNTNQIQTSFNTIQGKLEYEITNSTNRRRLRMKAPLDTGNAFRDRNSFVETGLNPSRKKTPSLL